MSEQDEHLLQPMEIADLYGGVWGEHPRYTAADWRYEVDNGYTRRSYWQWVHAKTNEAANEEN